MDSEITLIVFHTFLSHGGFGVALGQKSARKSTKYRIEVLAGASAENERRSGDEVKKNNFS